MNPFRYALRQLVKNPGFTTVVVVSIALGIAANTTVFSFVNSLLLIPPPVTDPKTLLQVWRFRSDASSSLKRHATWSFPALHHLRMSSTSCSGMGGVTLEPSRLTWSRDGVGETALGAFVTGNVFELAGIPAAVGRMFRSEEDQTPGTHPVMIVSHSFWRSHLSADPAAVGQTLTVNGVALTVIGVAPVDFTGILAGVAPDFWLPTMMRPAVLHEPDCLTSVSSHWLMGLARLNPGIPAASVEAELSTHCRDYDRSISRDEGRGGVALLPSYLVPVPLRGYVQGFTSVMMGSVVLVLLIACANVANLLLARSTARHSELVVRSALGAGRARLVGHLLAESLLLAGLGGVLGLLLASWLTQVLMQLVPPNLPLRIAIHFDWRVLAFTSVLTLLTGLAFGLAPALRGSRPDLVSALKGRGAGRSARQSRLIHVLIVGQMAVALTLLVGATLCLRSLVHAQSLNPGFEIQDRVAARLDLGAHGYTGPQAQEFQARMLAQVKSLPGVQSAVWTSYLPLGAERRNGWVQPEGQDSQAGDSGLLFEQFGVGPGYFATLGTPLLQGREFVDTDLPGSRRAVVINETAARRFWPGESPLGRRILVGGTGPDSAMEIVGVVASGRYRTLGEEPLPALYECFLQKPNPSAVLVVHGKGSSSSLLTALRTRVRDLDPRLVLVDATTLEEHLTLVLFPLRVSSLLLGGLGLVALVLSGSGLFGVIAFGVSQRTREVGIRMALGAGRRDVEWLVLRQGLAISSIGVGLGMAGALGVGRLLRTILLGVDSTDLATLVGVPLLLLGVSLAASWLPARWASRLDPLEALRAE